MPLDPVTLAQFSNRRSEILAANPLSQQAIQHNIAPWQNAFQGNPAAANALNECMQFLGAVPGGRLAINRQNIFDAVKKGINPQARFLMQMIWGYSENVNYGPSRVANLFRSPIINDPDRYGRVVENISAGIYFRAFEALYGVHGLSTSYVAKVLYFESRYNHFEKIPEHETEVRDKIHKNYALILDDKVSSGIVKVTSPWASCCVAINAPRSTNASNIWGKYWSYVEGCHEIAQHLKTEADHVEMFLFCL